MRPSCHCADGKDPWDDDGDDDGSGDNGGDESYQHDPGKWNPLSGRGAVGKHSD